MSACNQCLKVPCECMDDKAGLLRGEFPGWSVDAESRESFWMWRGDGPKPGTAQRVLVYSNGVYIGLGEDAPRCHAPDLLTAAEHATGETRLSRRAKGAAEVRERDEKRDTRSTIVEHMAALSEAFPGHKWTCSIGQNTSTSRPSTRTSSASGRCSFKR